jgi:hypothetical protein
VKPSQNQQEFHSQIQKKKKIRNGKKLIDKKKGKKLIDNIEFCVKNK